MCSVALETGKEQRTRVANGLEGVNKVIYETFLARNSFIIYTERYLYLQRPITNTLDKLSSLLSSVTNSTGMSNLKSFRKMELGRC